MYVLKKGIENFEVVDGAFAGKAFVRGRQYAQIPPEEKKKFEEVKSKAQGAERKELKKKTT